MSEELEGMLGPLLRDHVDSHEKLEVVLAVRARCGPIAVSDIAAALRLTQTDAKRLLSALCESGLLASQADGRFAEAEGALVRARIDALVQAYQADSLSVVSRLSRQALLRRRSSTAYRNSADRRRSARSRVR